MTATSRSPEHTAAPVEDGRGRDAEAPHHVPARGWKDVLVRVKAESKDDHVVLLAAGVALFGLLAMVPALIALMSIYGLVADPDTVDEQLVDALSAAPEEVRDLVSQQVRDIGDASSGAVVAVVGGLLFALWSASAGMKNLIEAINIAYDEKETRGFLKLRALSLAFTLGAIVFLVVAFAAIALVPSLLGASDLGTVGRAMVNVLRFVVLFAGALLGLAVLYRYAPDRNQPKWSWATPGAVVAAVVWVIGSLLFSALHGQLRPVQRDVRRTRRDRGHDPVAAPERARRDPRGSSSTANSNDKPCVTPRRARNARLARAHAYAADTVGPAADSA